VLLAKLENTVELLAHVLLLIVLLTVVACNESVDTGAGPTESDVLVTMVDHAAQPSLDQVAQTAGQLEVKVRQLADKPTAQTLAEAQSAWRDAYLSWLKASPFRFGPSEHLERQIGRWPVNGIVLDAAVTSAELKHLLSNPELRGYAAVEHLLFAPTDITAVTAKGRLSHLLDITQEIVRLTAKAKSQWDDDYAMQFKSAGDGKPFLIPADALSLVVRKSLNITETTLRDRIGMPSGFFEAPVKPDTLEAWQSGHTKASLKAINQGLRQVLVMDGDDASLRRLIATQDGLVETKNPTLAADIAKQLDRIDKTIEGLGGDDLKLEVELASHPTKLKRLYKQFQTLQDQLVEAALVLELDVHRASDMTVLTQKP
tara:strand:- start:662 stop:1777 length:1116 start_codon:yes stop_codon:yes gene_type:complete